MSGWRHWLRHPVCALAHSLRVRYETYTNTKHEAKMRSMTLLLRRLIETEIFSPEFFRLACQKFKVREMVVEGEYGPMQGAVLDRFIMAQYMEQGTYDREAVQFLKTQLRDGGLFLDVGANVGMYTIPLAANPNVQCIAFEPEPNNFLALQSNVARNCLHGNVICHQMAVMEAPGEITFEISPDNTGDHRIRHSTDVTDLLGEAARETITVRADRLDRLLRGVALESPVVAKIDVQGAELNVLRSAGAVLNSIDVMILEFWPYGLRRMGEKPDTLLAILREHFPFAGYTAWGRRLPLEIAPFEVAAENVRSIRFSDAEDFVDLVLMRHEPTLSLSSGPWSDGMNAASHISPMREMTQLMKIKSKSHTISRLG